MDMNNEKRGTIADDNAPQALRKKRPPIAVRTAELAAKALVTDAAEGTPNNPQDRSLLRDHRDRTTGADQAAREDMGAEDPKTLVDTSGTAPGSDGTSHGK